ncbi:Fanconi anemia group A protein-like [Callorhinchus milii]|nr:Fanconi anemia group A protein-like [Callorhinchus milii]|eukprot:gi/632944908/ref/XP_007887757.1/ PREDICTED: Fanconi anemia group A protein-like [Callorhinchus milii]
MIEDGDECAGADQPLRLNAAATNAEPLEFAVRDLLLKSFCQTLLTASHFNPPHRQGEWASLFVRTLCGHRRVLRAVLTRVLHLISHQGPSLSDSHILGLAAFAVHVHISQSFLPLVDSMDQEEKSGVKAGVFFSKHLTQFLSCTTGQSLTFCMRFCTAAVAYGLCLSSPSTVDIVKQAVPSGFVQKFLYVLPRLIPASRAEQGEVTESMWPNLTSPDLNWTSAALSAFKHSQFKELTRVKDFQLTFRDWLMAELDMQPHEDVLSDIDRQDYQHWVCYQHYLPSPCSAGGCGGDLETMCRTIINTLMDFSKRVKLQCCHQSDRSRPASLRTSCYVDILCRLQEMVFELEQVRARKVNKSARRESGHFLLDIFGERAASLGNTELRKQLEHELELQIFVRILVALPPSALFRTREERLTVTVECEEFFHFTNKELRNGYCKDGVILYDSTAHFFRGLLSACADCEEADHVLAAFLNECRARCPLLLLSAAWWWPRLEPVLVTQWKRFSEASLPRELQRLAEDHCWANRLLSGTVDDPPSDAPWILGAFLYFTFRRENRLWGLETVMRKICAENEQLQVSVLFLSLMDLISSTLLPKESLDLTVAVKTCADVVRALEEQDKPWLHVFLVTDKDCGPHQILHSMISDVQIRLLPLAFYRLVLDLGSTLLSSVIKRPGFLLIAVTMYAAMGQLYLDGEGVVPAFDYCAVQTPEQPDLLGLITHGRHFLLRTIPCCPRQTNSERKQLQEVCKDIDPEVKAKLDHNLQVGKSDEQYSEPDLL